MIDRPTGPPGGHAGPPLHAGPPGGHTGPPLHAASQASPLTVTLRPATGGGTWRPVLNGTGVAPLASRERGEGPGVRGVGSRWAAWADRLAQRYGVRGEAWDHLAALLLRQPGSDAQEHPGASWSTSWPVYLTLQVTIPAARATVQLPTEAPDRAPTTPEISTVFRNPQSAIRNPQWAAWPFAARVAESSAARLLRRETAVAPPSGELVTRLLARYEHRQGQAMEAAPVPTAWLDAPAPPRVVNRPVAAPARPDPAPATPPPFQPLPYWGDPPRPPVAPAVDVEQLTDQVLRSMDQRVIAARERLGKR